MFEYIPCSSETIELVTLYAETADHHRGEVIWQLARDGAPREHVFTPGTTPDGFRQVVALDGPLNPESPYVVAVVSNKQKIASENFRTDDLPHQGVMVAFGTDRVVSRAEFVADANDTCSSLGA